ncbi:hypothetical protein EVAR_102994_1 [Eumeta japonica]|uniref:Uncharacterized protein n=1 Tax=Eumeta variegata TaxID=151549 RepID=A0A4C1UPM5_EUMVA|nr:hypothetical protein EVAR_102994_1 [Eumeta japonica]
METERRRLPLRVLDAIAYRSIRHLSRRFGYSALSNAFVGIMVSIITVSSFNQIRHSVSLTPSTPICETLFAPATSESELRPVAELKLKVQRRVESKAIAETEIET